MRHQGRSYALQALYQAELLESKAMKHADRFLDQLETSPEVKLFARELVEGTLLHRKHIDRYLRRNLEHWKLNRLSTTVRNILRMAAYELYHHPELSHSVIINEAVELCKDFVDDSSHALTNSVLQRVYDQITAERKTKAQAKLEADSTDEKSNRRKIQQLSRTKKRQRRNQNIEGNRVSLISPLRVPVNFSRSPCT